MAVRRHVVAAAALAALVVLTGCSEDEPTPRLPEETPTSADPSPTEPETTDAAEETPEEFIRRWAAVEAEMENTGETDEYLMLSSGCRSCKELATTIEGFYADGGSVEWEGWDIRSVNRYGSVDGNRQYAVKVDSAPTRYRERSGGPLKTLDGGPATHVLTLQAQGSTWTVLQKSELAK